MLFSDSEDEEIAKQDTGLSSDTQTDAKKPEVELNEFLLDSGDKSDLRSLFSKHFTLSC